MVVAGAAAVTARATRLGWDETARDGKAAVLRFRFDSLAFGASGWTAQVSITNVSDKTIRIGDEFGVEVYANPSTTDPAKGLAFGDATSFSPPRPSLLKPGASWSGVVGGKGKPPDSAAARYLRLIVGPFSGVPGQKRPIIWISNHSLRLQGTGPSLPTA